jgi:Arc/MetJ-type ribon-helix-helix transcriptional regulator
LRFWVDAIAIEQHPSKEQQHDLQWLKSVVAAADLGVLLVLEAPGARALTRAWCLFEVAAVMSEGGQSTSHGNAEITKLALLYGSLSENYHSFREAEASELLEVAEGIDFARAEATFPNDIEVIHDAVRKVGGEEGRDAFEVVNRITREVVARGPLQRKIKEEDGEIIEVSDDTMNDLMARLSKHGVGPAAAPR